MSLPRRTRKSKAQVQLVVRAISAASQRGCLQFGAFRVPCALGRAGVRVLKREGDGATPRGRHRLRYVLYKQGLGARPRTALAVRAIRATDGWCDSPLDRNYNRRIDLPYPRSAERLWRIDHLYDVVVVLGYNDVPRIRNRGSAIFMHVARSNLSFTEGCVALRARDLRRVLAVVPRVSEIVIEI
jgi:L,D-peptidoglycan transpeptidase YkuD (ErfK/YbiS/YcfS/YnhG family)